MTKPLALSEVARAVLTATTEWAYENSKDSAKALDGDAAAIVRIMERSLNAFAAQTYLLAGDHARAEMQVMNGNAREKAAG